MVLIERERERELMIDNYDDYDYEMIILHGMGHTIGTQVELGTVTRVRVGLIRLDTDSP